ncbi:nucleotidyltransferase family protein [Hymenobacter sp. J193]|uniref:nucleotidyltransferase family protein n=1 Tax=Hymenobacter sp. J193 TaxID=2898429 RepID=UPI002151E7A4|nr:nucleotidyltransferase family protein [Hymenobacter sp. J193]MCR5889532.1 nucleotidyltransferase family protein [Hymenobacter sp. J193]
MPPIVLLAAGASSRLGRPKQLLPYQGKTLLRRAAETAVSAAAGDLVVVVTGAVHEELLPELAGLPVHVEHCPTWAAGMGASLKFGLQALSRLQPQVPGFTVMLCDQPHVTPGLLWELVEAHARTDRAVAAAEYGRVRGVPAYFAAACHGHLRRLSDHAGAGQLMREHPELVVGVPFPEGAIDVDTEEQYAALLAQG